MNQNWMIKDNYSQAMMVELITLDDKKLATLEWIRT